MKKLYKIFAAAALGMAAVGCIKEDFAPAAGEITNEGGEGVIVSASLPLETKVSYEMDAANKLIKTSWEEGDKFYMYSTWNISNGYEFTQTGAISEDGKFTNFQTTEEGTKRISANSGILFSYPTVYKSSSNGGLRIKALDGTLEKALESDMMYAYVKTDSKKVIPNIEFQRVTSFFEIKDLDFGAGVNATLKRVYVIGTPVGGVAKINTSTGEISTVERDMTIVIEPAEWTITDGKPDKKDPLYAAFIPVPGNQAGEEITLTFMMEDGSTYVKTWKTSSAYTAGNMYQVTGAVEKAITFNIQFEDPEVKNILVGGNNFHGNDLNGDGELSNVEASLITSLKWMFYQNSRIEKFNEFVYFTGISTFVGSSSTGGGGFLQCTNLKEITLPPTVDVIGSDAFNGCTALEKFVVPETVEKINAGAFRNCTNLKEITIPATVNYMGSGLTFANCTSLKTVNWPAATTTIPGSTFMESGLETFTIPETITEIGQQAFMNCTALKSITIPSSVKMIGASAFKGCTGISAFTVPSGVENIGNEAFFGTKATTFSIPASVTTIGQKAFNSNPSITNFTIESGSAYSVSEDVSMIVKTSGDVVEAVSFFGNKSEITFPANVTKIGNYFAQGSPDLVKVNIPAVSSLGNGVFQDCPKLTTAVYAAGATTTGNNTFQNCVALVDVTLPEAATQLGSNLFSGCTALKSVTIPSAVTKINSGVFTNCSSLEEVALPSSLTEIVNNLFKGCASLKKIDIPASVTKIGNTAFQGCTSLVELKLPETITTIPTGMIQDCSSITSITIPESVTTINANAFRNSGLTSFTFPSKVTAINGTLFMDCKNLKSLTIPATIKTIANGAFQGSGLETLTIPEGITKLSGSTFKNCLSLTKVVLPASLNTLSGSEFSGCTALKTVEMPGVTKIGNSEFEKCTALETLTFPEGLTAISTWCCTGCTSLKTINFPSTLTKFNTWAFEKCSSLKSVTIPAAVTSYGSLTFDGCTALEEVIVLSTTPCNIGSNVFPFATNDDLVIYVPDSAIEAYKAHASWSAEAFAGRIFAMSTRE